MANHFAPVFVRYGWRFVIDLPEYRTHSPELAIRAGCHATFGLGMYAGFGYNRETVRLSPDSLGLNERVKIGTLPVIVISRLLGSESEAGNGR